MTPSAEAIESAFYAKLRGKTTIRLIELGPGHVHQPIVVSLITVDSASALQYDAISYVWGNPDATTNIICDGRPTPITINLHWALLHVRKPDRPSIVWADAICINQRDVQERNHQVSMMGTIYANARTVYLCMGDDPDGGASDVLSILKELKPYMDGRAVSAFLQLDNIENDNRWFAVGTLTRRPWFRRAWVLQEAGLADNPRVHYGEVEFSYRDLIAVLRWLTRCTWCYRYEVNAWHIHMQWCNWRQAPSRPQYTFLDLLCHTTVLQCRDPRDHVYSFLGHPLAQLKGGSGSIVQPDYDKSPLTLFLEVTQALLQQNGLRVLSMVEHNEVTIGEDLPSWVLRWDVSDVLNGIDRVGSHFNASVGFDAPFVCEGTNLVLQGMKLDAVRLSYQAVETREKGMTFLNASENAQSTMRQVLDFLSSQYGDHMIEAICRTLCAGTVGDGSTARSSAITLALALDHRQDMGFMIGQEEYKDVLDFWQKMNAYCIGHSLIVTHQGHFALGPRITRPGDQCYILQGANVPFFLRPHASGNRFRLLGEAYVHCFMKGQIKSYAEEERLQSDTLILY
jgi:hypothetical protein